MSAPVTLNVLDAPPGPVDLNALDDQICAMLAEGIHPQQIAFDLDCDLSDVVRVAGAGAQR
jgi:hypothetical protein